MFDSVNVAVELTDLLLEQIDLPLRCGLLVEQLVQSRPHEMQLVLLVIQFLRDDLIEFAAFPLEESLDDPM